MRTILRLVHSTNLIQVIATDLSPIQPTWYVHIGFFFAELEAFLNLTLDFWVKGIDVLI
jgi:hypothetical protein